MHHFNLSDFRICWWRSKHPLFLFLFPLVLIKSPFVSYSWAESTSRASEAENTIFHKSKSQQDRKVNRTDQPQSTDLRCTTEVKFNPPSDFYLQQKSCFKFSLVWDAKDNLWRANVFISDLWHIFRLLWFGNNGLLEWKLKHLLCSFMSPLWGCGVRATICATRPPRSIRHLSGGVRAAFHFL